MKKLRIGVIGTGNISHEHISAYMNNPHCELYALCDIDEETLAAKGKKYGVDRLFTDCGEMFAALPELDAVSVCTWNSAHAPCAIAALQAGKHVFCEKPMAMSAAEAEQMRQEAKKAGKLLALGFVRRFGKDADLVRELVKEGMLGEIYYAKAAYIRRNGSPGGWFTDRARSGGGPLIDLGVHVIDLVRYLAGNPLPVSVYGAAFYKLGERKLNEVKAYTATRADENKCDVEDLAAAMIRFSDGMVLNVETSYALNTAAESGRIELFGTKGGVRIDPGVSLHTVTAGKLSDVTFPSPAMFGGEAYRKEIDEFIDAIISGTPLRANADDGVEMMKILDAIYRSAQTGHEVSIAL